jgi:hypothetical protein
MFSYKCWEEVINFIEITGRVILVESCCIECEIWCIETYLLYRIFVGITIPILSAIASSESYYLQIISFCQAVGIGTRIEGCDGIKNETWAERCGIIICVW